MDSRRDRHFGACGVLGDALAGAPGPAAEWQVTGMSETCDRCGPAVGAAYRVGRIGRIGELYLCGRCASRQWRALSAQGWTFWPLGVHALAPQASAYPMRCDCEPGPA
jgi:hypothetical protein